MKKLIYFLTICVLLFCASCTTICEPPPSSGTDESNVVVDTPDISGIYLEISDKFAAGDIITYTYVNNTDAAINIPSIPRLEQKTSDGWSEVSVRVGVMSCVTPDSIAARSRSLEWELDTEFLYGSALEPGIYKLSFQLSDDEYKPTDIIYAMFEVL